MVRLVAALVIALVLAPLPSSASDPLQLRLSQRLMTAPGALQITMIVEKHDVNRALIVEAESETFYRSSLITLNGSSAALFHSIRYTQLPEGAYLIRVSLYGGSEKLAVREQELEVVGHRPEPLSTP